MEGTPASSFELLVFGVIVFTWTHKTQKWMVTIPMYFLRARAKVLKIILKINQNESIDIHTVIVTCMVFANSFSLRDLSLIIL